LKVSKDDFARTFHKCEFSEEIGELKRTFKKLVFFIAEKWLLCNPQLEMLAKFLVGVEQP
jgi:hypothetical protein